MTNFEFTPEQLDQFHRAYMACAAWSTCDTDEEGEYREFEDFEFSTDCHNAMLNDCKQFTNYYAPLIFRAIRTHAGYTIEQAGHDFWLTRNHHGAGFWDRGLGRIGQWLTEVSYQEGSVDLYLNNNEEIEQQNY